jgi:hypothetical protein
MGIKAPPHQAAALRLNELQRLWSGQKTGSDPLKLRMRVCLGCVQSMMQMICSNVTLFTMRARAIIFCLDFTSQPSERNTTESLFKAQCHGPDTFRGPLRESAVRRPGLFWSISASSCVAHASFLAVIVEKMSTYGTVAPVYVGGAALSLLSALYALRLSRRQGKRLTLTSPSALILILTFLDVLYSLKFAVSALVWYALGSSSADNRKSFHAFDDDCLSSVIYEQFIGMACISLNVVWPLGARAALLNPARSCCSDCCTLCSQCWIFNFVYTLYKPLVNTRKFM